MVRHLVSFLSLILCMTSENYTTRSAAYFGGVKITWRKDDYLESSNSPKNAAYECPQDLCSAKLVLASWQHHKVMAPILRL